MLAGSQSFASALSKTTSAHFLTGNFEQNVGTNYFPQGDTPSTAAAVRTTTSGCSLSDIGSTTVIPKTGAF